MTLYTVGNEQIYLSAMRGGTLVKKAVSPAYRSSKVWLTLEAAEAAAEPEHAVFAVNATHEHTTPSAVPEATWLDLAKDADVILIPERHYFTNRTPFLVGMPADHALKIINKTGRRTKRAPEEIGEDEHGMVVRWFLADCTLILRRMKPFPAPYVVTGIKPKDVKNV